MSSLTDTAVIFDMDGVIFDSERACLTCWQTLAEKYRIPDIETSFLACTGTTDAKTREIMLSIYGEDFPYESFAKEASALFHERYDGGRLPVKKGVPELFSFLQEKHVPMALASSTRRVTVLRELEEAGLLSFFQVVIGGDSLKRSKPAPDIYQMAAGELGIDPSLSFAIEDSYNGIRSAHAAHLRPLMVVDLLPADEEMHRLAEGVFSDLLEVREYLRERLA